jgi:hypothetical protein
LFEPTVACAIAGDMRVRGPGVHGGAGRSRPGSGAALAAPRRGVAGQPRRPQPAAFPLALRADLTAPSTLSRVRLESPGRSWPFALAATADAATTYWALARGGAERNPLLALGRADVGMVKIIQFPLLAKAVDMVEARDPRLGRRLRWVTLAFHALLAFNNVRLGRMAGELGLDAPRHARRP